MGACCGSRRRKVKVLTKEEMELRGIPLPLEGDNRKFVKKINRYWLAQDNPVQISFDG